MSATPQQSKHPKYYNVLSQEQIYNHKLKTDFLLKHHINILTCVRDIGAIIKTVDTRQTRCVYMHGGFVYQILSQLMRDQEPNFSMTTDIDIVIPVEDINNIHTVSFKKKYPCMRLSKKVYMIPRFYIIQSIVTFY